ncbi:MAG: histidine--tRNA ligase [Candidatus Levybacteria bacterium RBG_13_35_9]|nr:MAG: histidine--tRNA ligase [Candidatus Levybacteria bacterium RBG_13_35_9]
MANLQTLKGFRDFLPENARKRQFVLDTLKKVFESYGFEPLETPSLEYEEILTGKYGDEGDKLMYRFEDNGKRKVAMRYDQTVPLARAITQYANALPFPFKRYQIQNVWRAENTQKGRYREFLQVDADIVGSSSPLADLEILEMTTDCLNKLGFKSFTILVNSRKVFEKFDVDQKTISILDKEDKIGKDAVVKSLSEYLGRDKAEKFYSMLKDVKPEEIPGSLQAILKNQNKLKLFFNPFLARGLNYYTDLIFEVKIGEIESGSIAGGGRYDKLIGIFSGKDIPAVGFSFGFDRLIEAMEQLNLFPGNLNGNRILVAFADSDLQEKAMKISAELRSKNLNAEFYLDDEPLEKQLKYADKKKIANVLIVNSNNFILKNMALGKQKEVTLEKLPNELE